MEIIQSKGKEFEYLVATHDPLFSDMVNAIDIVKQFVIENHLIMYGGSAIDYALRLKGDKIYPDDLLKVPDLDFYSPTNVEHAYQLADLLFLRGFREARAVNAQHTETMKVDLADNHWVADVSYRPLAIFEKLPYLEYNGMRIIHPDFQRVDVHSSLSFPYDNAPREVIFERWSKDIKRFNKLALHYPIAHPGGALATRTSTTNLHEFVFTGFIAYAILYGEFKKLMREGNIDTSTLYKDIDSAVLSKDGDELTFDTIDQACEIVHFDPMKAIDTLGIAKYKHYEPYINLLPERYEGMVPKSSSKIVIYSTRNRLLTTDTVRLEGPGGHIVYRITNIQYLLKHFLSMYFIARDTPKLAATYLGRYVSLINMINMVEERFTGTEVRDTTARLFFPTTRTYGNENINLAREIALNRLQSDLNDEPLYKIPPNYYPVRAKLRGAGHPVFIPRDLIFFHVEGLEITDTVVPTV